MRVSKGEAWSGERKRWALQTQSRGSSYMLPAFEKTSTLVKNSGALGDLPAFENESDWTPVGIPVIDVFSDAFPEVVCPLGIVNHDASVVANIGFMLRPKCGGDGGGGIPRMLSYLNVRFALLRRKEMTDSKDRIVNFGEVWHRDSQPKEDRSV